MPFSFIPCLLRRSHGLLHACYVVLPIRRLLNIYVVFHLFVSSLLLTFLLFFLARCRSPDRLPERLSPTETVLSPSSRMPARGRIHVSALGPSSLSVPHGRGRGRCPDRHRVVPSVGGSMLPSWILGNPVVVSSVRLVISFVQQQMLSRFPHAALSGGAVPLWAYVSHQWLCINLISFLLCNIADQSTSSNAYHKYFLAMLALLCTFPPYVFSRCDSLSSDVICSIVLHIAARDNRCVIWRGSGVRAL
jgi:hypothetical protein